MKKIYNPETQTLFTETDRMIVDENGEVQNVVETKEMHYGANFFKLYKLEFLKVLSGFNNPKIDVMIYICDNMQESNNTFLGTVDSIAKSTCISKKTVIETLKILDKGNFIRRIRNGVYVINPDVMYKGDMAKQHYIRELFYDGKGETGTKRKGKTRLIQDSIEKREMAKSERDFAKEIITPDDDCYDDSYELPF